MNSSSIIRYILYATVLILMLAVIKFASVYQRSYSPNVHTPGGDPFYLFIATGADFQNVLDSIYGHKLVKNKKNFEWLAVKKKYASHIHAGRYKVSNNMSNNSFINMLRSGLQEPVKLVINSIRTPEDLARKISAQLEPDSGTLLRLLHDESFIGQYGFNRQTIMGMFIPNTYEFWWNTTADAVFKRMYNNYNKFWNDDRQYKAKIMNFDRNGVITLASILINETNKEDEYRRMAGVYVNRLNRGIKLQADPTVKFALGDYERKRILKKDIQVDSRYNTYLYYGLPPGPIALPSIKAIDAVLDYERHEYLFFCAKEDFSGHHNFAKTLDQHNKYARSYQKALNRRNILK
jgi:UPF0755 protein